jgi:hypothetical protein
LEKKTVQIKLEENNSKALKISDRLFGQFYHQKISTINCLRCIQLIDLGEVEWAQHLLSTYLSFRGD